MPVARIVQFPAARTFRRQPSRRTKLLTVVGQLTSADIELLDKIARQLIAVHATEGPR